MSLKLNTDIETYVRSMSTRRRIPSKSTEDVSDSHCKFSTNADAYSVCLISSLLSVLGCSPSDALPGARAAVYEWKPGSRELQQVQGLIITLHPHSSCLSLWVLMVPCVVHVDLIQFVIKHHLMKWCHCFFLPSPVSSLLCGITQ